MLQSITFTVTGMKCSGCEINAKTRLEALDGIVTATPDHKSQQISVDFESTKLDSNSIRAFIKQAGYQVA